MKTKRFFAPTMQQALRQVREELGADAVILSNRRVDGGVEIVSALDYDESQVRERLGVADTDTSGASHLAEMQAERHRLLEKELEQSRHRIQEVRSRRAREGAEHQEAAPQPQRPAPAPAGISQDDALAEMRAEIHSLRAMMESRPQAAESSRPSRTNLLQQRLTERLQDLGLDAGLARDLAPANVSGRLDTAWKTAVKNLAGRLSVEQSELIERGGVFALVGPTGSGKTTTISKMAARYVLRHGEDKVALVTTDRYRVAAHEQLFVFGRILNVPVRVVDEENSLDQILDDLRDRHLVLIDTAGLNAADQGWREQMEELSQSRHPIKPYLVVAATSQPRVMKSTWHCYKMVGLAGCVMTKLDEALTLGEVIGFAVESKLPVAYYTDGQRIPQDLHRAGSASLVKMALKRLQASGEGAVNLSTGT
ncbi:flagellar biosynthesis protein FlhF [Marinobacteraceae bacterium S3BR75-40.1]